MTSSRPYLIRAIHEWIVDNGMTPYVLVNADAGGVVVPPQHVQDGRIVLNLAPRAVAGLVMGNERIEFRARFGGVERALTVPVAAVLAIYAQENGQGMAFTDDGGDDGGDGDGPAPERPKRPALKVVK